MKTNKEQVYDFIRLHSASAEVGGVSTQYLAQALGIQRTNVSSILNALVDEGTVAKSNGRPVLYYIRHERGESDAFRNFIGWGGSLHRAVQLAKAAVLYPQRSLDILISGESGSGKSFLAQVIHRFAVESGVLVKEAPFLCFNCRDYQGDESRAIHALFGTDSTALFLAAAGGVLLIDNAHLLSPRLRSLIFDKLDPAKRSEDEGQSSDPMVIVTCEGGNRELIAEFERRLPVSITLPDLCQRPLQERLELIERFFTLEAARAKRPAVVGAELLRCLLLYDCPRNLTQLKGEIKLGCASGYVRERDGNKPLALYMSDFSHEIRKGFLNYAIHRDEVDAIVPSGCKFSFDQNTVEMTPMDREKLSVSSLYDDMDHRVQELSSMGLGEGDIDAMMNATISAVFDQYRNSVATQVVNREQLSRLVDQRIIDLVEDFIRTAQIKAEHPFPPSAVYGLCLHIQSLFSGRAHSRKLSGDQLKKVMEQNRAEYMLTIQLAARLEQELSLRISADELAFLTLFLSDRSIKAGASGSSILFFAFHGHGIATALARSVEAIVHSGSVFACDIPFEQSSEDTYAALKAAVEQSNRGGGVVALYDVSVLGEMLRTIALETDIDLRIIRFPITTLGIEWARQSGMPGDLNTLHRRVLDSLGDLRIPTTRVIVTLCATGVGGATQIKKYVEQFGQLDADTKVIPLALSDQELLREMLMQVTEHGVIQCVIGPTDPHLMGLPFIPLSELFGAPSEKVPSIVRLKQRERSSIDFSQVYGYLESHLELVDIEKLKATLPSVIEQINALITELALDSEIGLFLHLACSLNRMLGKESQPQNLNREAIIRANHADYKAVLRILKPLEKSFGVVFNDDEVANIITIIRKL